ncbi:MAG: efflux RND transporter periplasmic adaptor subunit [Herpetosiphonaceae bacterium]|nr:efflux RND transporter periplasmic adaptor subunit [Herpetosiphonaceae bacterium]
MTDRGTLISRTSRSSMHSGWQLRRFLLLLLVLSACGPQLVATPAEGPTPTAVPTRPPYDPSAVRTVERHDLVNAASGRATIVPKLTNDLFFRRDGRIARIDVAVGDEVKQGQILARLEQTDLEYQIGLAQIDVQLAELRARNARDKKSPQLDIDIADKETDRTRLALQRLQTEQKDLLVTAPYNGRVRKISANPGSEITAYKPVATIIGSEQLIVLAEFSGAQGAHISEGQEIEFREFATDKLIFKGKVTGKAGDANPDGWIVEPVTNASTPQPKLNLGDTFKAVAVLGRATNVLTLPSATIKTIGDRHYVLLIENGNLRRVFVETGIETEGIVEIKSGLQAGQQVSEH